MVVCIENMGCFFLAEYNIRKLIFRALGCNRQPFEDVSLTKKMVIFQLVILIFAGVIVTPQDDNILGFGDPTDLLPTLEIHP